MTFDLEKFNRETYAIMTETADQQINLFNAASGGAIQLISDPHSGDVDVKASFKKIAGLVRRRNINGTGALTKSTLEMLKDIAVKVAAGTPPVEWTPSHYQWVMLNPELAAVVIGEQLAVGKIGDMLNAAILSTATAISTNADLTHTVAGKPTFRVLGKGTAKFGDRASAIKAHVMHSATAFELYDNALTNGENLFSYETVDVVKDPMGKLLVISDSPALIDGSNYRTLSLVSDAAVVSDNKDFNSVIVPKTGSENLLYEFQAEWTYTVGVRGYKWAGGGSPNDTEIGTATSWEKTATSDKDTAGVLVVTQ